MPPLPLPPPSRDLRFSLGVRKVCGEHAVFSVIERAIGKHAESSAVAATLVCPDWCNVVALTEDDEVVLIYQHRFGTDSVTLEIPGGAVDPGESPLAAAGRELLEETGYEAADIRPLAEVHPNPAIQGNRCFSFLATGARRVRAPSFDEHEACEVVLVSRAQVGALLDEGHVTHALAVLALERALRKWGSP